MPFFFQNLFRSSLDRNASTERCVRRIRTYFFFPETQLFLEFSKKITTMPSETFLCSISLVIWLYSEIWGEKLKMEFFIIILMCLVCADTFGVLLSLKTWKYGQNPFDWCPLELCTTKTRSCGSPQSWVIFDQNHRFLDFEIFLK